MPNKTTSLFRAEFCEQARKLCLLGAIDRDLARIFEVSERTINRWKRQHPDFAAALKAGKAVADGEVAGALHEKALKGDMTAISFWLRNRRPDLWRDRREAPAKPDGSAAPEAEAMSGRELAKSVSLILKRGIDATK
jgi:transposase-like protein